jgi:hypothetical protein
MNNKISGIIRFQQQYRFYKAEMNKLTDKVLYLKETLLCMVNNLEYLNDMKIYNGYKNGYSVIFNELTKLCETMKHIPSHITFKTLRENNLTFSELNYNIYRLNEDIVKYMNHIAPNDIFNIFKLTIGDNWFENFTYDDMELINLLVRIFVPINVWISNVHNDVEYVNIEKRQVNDDSVIENLMNNQTSIVVGDSSLPSFLNKLTEYIIKEKSSGDERKLKFDVSDIEDMFDDSYNNIIITENNYTKTFVENNRGIIMYFKINNKYVVIQGIIKNDIMDIFKSHYIVKNKLAGIKKKIFYEVLVVPKTFKVNYLKTISIRDFLVKDETFHCNVLKNRYNDYKKIKNQQLHNLINEFLLSSKQRKVDYLTILLMSNEDVDKKIAFLLYDIMRMKDKNNIISEILNILPIEFRNNLDIGEELLEKDEKNIMKIDSSDISYEKRISLMNTDDNIKSKAIDKLKSIKNNLQGDNKAQSWLDGLLKIPFGIYKENSIMMFKNSFTQKLKELYPNSNLYSFDQIDKFMGTINNEELNHEWNDYKTNRVNYLKQVREKLDDAVYGHLDAKKQLERVFAQWINGESKGEILGLWGPPGTGKTSLAKRGLSRCLIDDDGNNRPFSFLPIGGSVNGSTLVGHNYTYVGSTWGRIVEILISSKCMNPIIFIDELDKISNTENGREISSILTHLTDLTQNDTFEDKYFAGIPFDLSKALIVFSFNDIDRIDPILRDRINIIETKAFTLEDKVKIITDYMLPDMLKELGYDKDEIVFPQELIEFIINSYTNEAGVRKIKEKLMEIIREINLNISYGNDNYSIPFTVTKDFVEDLFKTKPKMRIKKICKEPSIGLVNGLYATTTGVGGLTVIQIMKYPSDKMLELSLTGQQGDVMKESVNYALRIAFSLLTEKEQNKILTDNKDGKNFGLHIHTPDAATKKDGPSAGAAMTLGIYSILSGKKVNNKVALTGEIDLMRNVTAIGGVYAKLMGAKQSGVELALIPEENWDDLLVLREKGISPEDDSFKVESISCIQDVIDKCIYT